MNRGFVKFRVFDKGLRKAYEDSYTGLPVVCGWGDRGRSTATVGIIKAIELTAQLLITLDLQLCYVDSESYFLLSFFQVLGRIVLEETRHNLDVTP